MGPATAGAGAGAGVEAAGAEAREVVVVETLGAAPFRAFTGAFFGAAGFLGAVYTKGPLSIADGTVVF